MLTTNQKFSILLIIFLTFYKNYKSPSMHILHSGSFYTDLAHFQAFSGGFLRTNFGQILTASWYFCVFWDISYLFWAPFFAIFGFLSSPKWVKLMQNNLPWYWCLMQSKSEIGKESRRPFFYVARLDWVWWWMLFA